LLDAFKELHEEGRKLQYSNIMEKGENRWLGNRLKQLEEENENLKTSLEELEKTNKNHVCNCKRIIPKCENFPR